jgi:aminopeptidase N
MTDRNSRVLLPSTVKPLHYDLELSPDLKLFQFYGSMKVQVSVVEETSVISLHAKEIDILSAAFVHDSEGEVIAFSISENRALSVVTFAFPVVFGKGNGMLSIQFRGVLNNKMAGFYRSSYIDASGSPCIMACTQFAPLDARRAFPCWDEPGQKATFDISMVIPSHLQAISNMPIISCRHMSGSKKKVVFDRTPLISTYLIAFAVGEFDCISETTGHGVACSVLTPPGKAEQGRFALSVAVKCLDFYDDFFQIPYPLPKLDMCK